MKIIKLLLIFIYSLLLFSLISSVNVSEKSLNLDKITTENLKASLTTSNNLSIQAKTKSSNKVYSLARTRSIVIYDFLFNRKLLLKHILLI